MAKQIVFLRTVVERLIQKNGERHQLMKKEAVGGEQFEFESCHH